MSAHPSVGIIGVGPGGLALRIVLSRAGFHDFIIFASWPEPVVSSRRE